MLAHYGDQPVARPILGTEERIRGCTREELHGYWSRMYRPQNAVLALAGNYVWEDVVRLAEAMLGQWRPEGFSKRDCVTRDAAPGIITREKDIEQVNICLGYPGLNLADERNFDLAIGNSVFGGAMSSRLFQKIREERGMAYTVYSSPNGYTDAGVLSVYAATNPETANAVVDMILEEARRMAEHGLTDAEFAMSKEQLKAGFILGTESTSTRMQAIGRRMLLRNNTRTDAEILDLIQAVRHEDVDALMREILIAPHSTALVGKGVDGIAAKIG